MGCNITVQMSADTANQVWNAGERIWGFKAVSTNECVTPGTWWETTAELETTISWSNNNIAYFFDAGIVKPQWNVFLSRGGIINPDNNWRVEPGGRPGAVTVINLEGGSMTWGLGDDTNLLTSQACKVNNPKSPSVIAPLDIALFMIAPFVDDQWFDAPETLPAPGLLVDLSNGPYVTTITYDINNGWSGGPETTHYPAGTHLWPLLVLPMS